MSQELGLRWANHKVKRLAPLYSTSCPYGLVILSIHEFQLHRPLYILNALSALNQLSVLTCYWTTSSPESIYIHASTLLYQTSIAFCKHYKYKTLSQIGWYLRWVYTRTPRCNILHTAVSYLQLQAYYTTFTVIKVRLYTQYIIYLF